MSAIHCDKQVLNDDKLIANLLGNIKCLRLQLAEKSTSVSVGDHAKVMNALEVERNAHSETRLRLLETQQELDFTKGQLAILKTETEEEKNALLAKNERLLTRIEEQTQRRTSLQKKVDKGHRKTENHMEIITIQNQALLGLCEELNQEKSRVAHAVDELELQRQQQRYLSDMRMRDHKAGTESRISSTKS